MLFINNYIITFQNINIFNLRFTIKLLILIVLNNIILI